MRAVALQSVIPCADADEPRPRIGLRDARVEVSAITRARTPHGERSVRIAGLSARTALVVSAEPLGWTGQCIELDVPIVGGHDLRVMAGIARTERCRDGHAATVEFVVVDSKVRRQLNELLALLLEHESTVEAHKRRVVYDVAVTYGATGQLRAHLQELSITGLSMRLKARMAHGFVVDVAVPTLRGGAPLMLRGSVAGQRLSAEGGYVTAIDFEPLDGSQRQALGVLLADLMCR